MMIAARGLIILYSSIFQPNSSLDRTVQLENPKILAALAYF